MRYGTKTVHAFTCKVISYIKENLHAITKILYFSDGAANQYKNFKNFANLCYHEIDHGIQAQWHFFATSHGKSPCDGTGGTIKQFVARETLQATENYQILSPYEMFQWAKQNIAEIIFFMWLIKKFQKMPKLINWNKNIRIVQQFLAQDFLTASSTILGVSKHFEQRGMYRFFWTSLGQSQKHSLRKTVNK